MLRVYSQQDLVPVQLLDIPGAPHGGNSPLKRKRFNETATPMGQQFLNKMVDQDWQGVPFDTQGKNSGCLRKGMNTLETKREGQWNGTSLHL
jgi:hypothetical protein